MPHLWKVFWVWFVSIVQIGFNMFLTRPEDRFRCRPSTYTNLDFKCGIGFRISFCYAEDRTERKENVLGTFSAKGPTGRAISDSSDSRTIGRIFNAEWGRVTGSTDTVEINRYNGPNRRFMNTIKGWI